MTWSVHSFTTLSLDDMIWYCRIAGDLVVERFRGGCAAPDRRRIIRTASHASDM